MTHGRDAKTREYRKAGWRKQPPRNYVAYAREAGQTRPRTVKDWRAVIEREVPWVDVKPYSHNIISIALSSIGRKNRKAANKAIRDFGLERLGWRQEEEQ